MILARPIFVLKDLCLSKVFRSESLSRSLRVHLNESNEIRARKRLTTKNYYSSQCSLEKDFKTVGVGIIRIVSSCNASKWKSLIKCKKNLAHAGGFLKEKIILTRL